MGTFQNEALWSNLDLRNSRNVPRCPCTKAVRCWAGLPYGCFRAAGAILIERRQSPWGLAPIAGGWPSCGGGWPSDGGGLSLVRRGLVVVRRGLVVVWRGLALVWRGLVPIAGGRPSYGGGCPHTLDFTPSGRHKDKREI
jgi:hypothetical protein